MAMDCSPAVFAQSSTVAIAVQDKNGIVCTFYLHKSLLVQHSEGFAHCLEKQDPSKLSVEPALTLPATPHAAFGDFVCWLYGNRSPSRSILTRLPSLRKLATDWRIPAFDKYLLGWCEDHCSLDDWLGLLQDLARDRVSPTERLPQYALEKLAYEITTQGWMDFIQDAGDQWRRFMSEPDNRSYSKKGYLSELMSKLQNAEMLTLSGTLTDPATSIQKWFPLEQEHAPGNDLDPTMPSVSTEAPVPPPQDHF